MLFSSIEFLIFFPIVLALYWGLNVKARRPLLLLASYYFYLSWNPPFIILLIFSTIVDFSVAKRLMIETEKKRRLGLLLISLVSNLSLLGYFKYAAFFVENLQLIGLDHSFNVDALILPLGISFYTFQTMSYTIDVYRGKLAASNRFFDFALYVSFFPQLIAGPIVRATEFLPQFDPMPKANAVQLKWGAQLLLIGFFKKVFLADYLAIAVDAHMVDPQALTFAEAWISIYCFALQIYFDFSGYSDIARGLGALLGFDIPENFNLPYLATNITDFWRRWHMTLSTWLRDYLYISLGGNRVSRLKTYRNLMITMLLGGLWHGAGWNFVIWGGLHGTYLAVHKFFMERRGEDYKSPENVSGWRRWGSIFLTFHLVCITWVFFRVPGFEDAIAMVKTMFLFNDLSFSVSPALIYTPFIQTCMVYSLLRLYLSHSEGSKTWASIPFFIGLVLFMIVYVPPGTRKFIYFEF
ncbi:MAG: MBOAT family protein [Planctomycetota bacterium]|nr:MBOAT family protein [Planctomycetota bacterium]